MKKLAKKRISLYMRPYLILIIIAVLVITYVSTEVILWALNWFFDISLIIPDTLSGIILSLVLGGTLATVLSKSLLSPISKLSTEMRSVAEGNFGNRIDSKSSVKEVQRLYDDFNLMVEELASTEILQTDFVSNVSHEFKTPISAIDGYATLLQGDNQMSDETNEYIDKILFNTRRLSELVSNILLLSKLDNQSILGKRDIFSLDEQIRQAIVSLEPCWEKKEIDFDVDLDEVSFFGNEQTLSHVWMNLIDNAIKFSPSRGVITIKLKVADNKATVTVTDCGPGVPETDIIRIFDRFYQSDSSHKGEGNGLGLALVKQIAEMHGGSVRAENNSNGGSTFTVILPITEV